MSTIDRFSGRYRFLSNFHASEVKWEGVTYPSVEHAYQADKTLDADLREQIRDSSSAAKAKKLGKSIICRPDWEERKIWTMLSLVRLKFEHIGLRQLLLDTGDSDLVEGNKWGDHWWGICDGFGFNYLGRILMLVRDEIRSGNTISDDEVRRKLELQSATHRNELV